MMIRPARSLDDALVDLLSVPRMTGPRLASLLARFEKPEQVFRAGRDELVAVDGVDEELAEAILSYKRNAGLERRLEQARALDVWTMTVTDPNFPSRLKELAHCPPVLFVRGEISEQDRMAAAVVGTRRPSSYGRLVAEKLGRDLAEHGVTVVSGLARGVDTCAHRGALACNGRTIAVLGCGIDVCYPPENRSLAEEIASHGALVTEFNLGVGPLAMNFPRRNRIVSGLSQVVIAVEAGERSGVLNTVAWARDQGRVVFAVPGRLTDQTSVGTNRLLRDGAKVFVGVEDVLRELGVALRPAEQAAVEVTEDEKPVMDFLSGDPQHVDDVCQALGIPVSTLLGVLVRLELKGLVRQLPGKLFVRQV
ncbi:MAG: DNA-processing protein DprA [candidate division WOR-3 bacterium]